MKQHREILHGFSEILQEHTDAAGPSSSDVPVPEHHQNALDSVKLLRELDEEAPGRLSLDYAKSPSSDAEYDLVRMFFRNVRLWGNP